ncbi:RIO1 family [Coleofasciculus chthonoplastes PCC 7420]|uniref:non-specific serine/threonine protein kinase n=1 Tax=Coleofasciculus chthonoplastes PCC 7420 TaxID=118168 RepID=B4VML9_9CYAN|nr:serine/threonine-protein kinase [Coleofasciculus chthonoplastes]EDX76753.1 RIO1 family [Coleofasciculus chthonoplastes PCC 7420]
MTPTLLNNRYRILQTLGAGGFGNTFLAEDTYMPSGRKCVIKQLKPMTHDPQTYQQVKERFQREAAVLEELGESNHQIPRLFAYFSESGQFYLVQEWIEGDTLTQIVDREGRLNDGQVKAILLSLLPVLDYVHSCHIVHRDLKPDNVIVRRRDGLPVLIDFGAVKEAIKTVVHSQAHTTPSIVIGTPGFMAAEQAAGRPRYASDLYSLGLIAVFLLTGKLPQTLETDTRTGEILWRRDAPNCHSHLATVIDQAIRFHPRDRFADAKEMLEALNAHPTTIATPTLSLSSSSEAVPSTRKPAVPPTVPIRRKPLQADEEQPSRRFGGLIAGGLLLSAVAIGWGLNRVLEPSNRIPSPPESVSASSENTPLPSPTPPPTASPVSTPPPKLVNPESPPPLSPPDPTFRIQESPELLPSPDPPAPFASEPSVLPSPSPSPSPVTSPTPTPSPSPLSVPENHTPKPPRSNKIPGFTPGTPRKVVEAALGTPTQQTKGLWHNTQALTYEDFIRDRVSLGYLFDRDTKRLRQTEVAFSQSVGLETMANTLDKMLSRNLSPEIRQGLTQVYQRQSNRYRFNSSNGSPLKGVIERNERDRIYIGVWEADLH